MKYQEDVLKKAVDTWGAESQIGMLMEEMGELMSAINRRHRCRTDKSTVEEELADVEIMLDQMRHIFDAEEVDRFKRLKIDRLEARLGMESPMACYGFDSKVYPDCMIVKGKSCQFFEPNPDNGICKHWRVIE